MELAKPTEYREGGNSPSARPMDDHDVLFAIAQSYRWPHMVLHYADPLHPYFHGADGMLKQCRMPRVEELVSVPQGMELSPYVRNYIGKLNALAEETNGIIERARLEKDPKQLKELLEPARKNYATFGEVRDSVHYDLAVLVDRWRAEGRL